MFSYISKNNSNPMEGLSWVVGRRGQHSLVQYFGDRRGLVGGLRHIIKANAASFT